MKFRKLISVLAASTMLASLVSFNASAAVSFDYDEGYYISNVLDVAQRTPYIETTVTQLTSEQVVALNGGTSGLSNKKLKDTAGSFGDTTTWTVYKIDGTFKNVGNLGIGYDSNDNLTAYIKVKALDATMDFSSIAELGAQNTNWYVSVDTKNEPTLGAAWALQNFGTNRGVAINLVEAYPTASMGETAEGELIDVDYSFTMYLVVPAGTTKTISYAAGNASVQYWVGNAVESVDNQLVENKVASRTSSFTIQESSVTTYTYTFRTYDDNGTGTPIATSTLDAGDAVVAPTAPARTGYTFVGWATSAGGATVTIDTTATADTTYYAVYSKDPVPVTSVSLDKSELTFKVGGAAQTLTATVDPSDADVKTVEWSTSNPSVATVVNGVVTPVGAGKATITVASTENSEKSATCTVKVNPADVTSANFKAVANGDALTDLAGKAVAGGASKNYGAGRINADINTGEFTYEVVATDGKDEKAWALPSELEVAGNINFIAIVKSASHVITNIFLRATVK